MYLYLSILNNKIIYIQDYHIHHINGNPLDNRIENLQLVTRSEHNILEKIKDMSGRFCNICKTNETYIRKSGCPSWYDDIEGHLCDICYDMIKYYRKKFGIIIIC
jgi:hypothetical protein